MRKALGEVKLNEVAGTEIDISPDKELYGGSNKLKREGT